MEDHVGAEQDEVEGHQQTAGNPFPRAPAAANEPAQGHEHGHHPNDDRSQSTGHGDGRRSTPALPGHEPARHGPAARDGRGEHDRTHVSCLLPQDQASDRRSDRQNGEQHDNSGKRDASLVDHDRPRPEAMATSQKSPATNPSPRPIGPRNAVPSLASRKPPTTMGRNITSPAAMIREAQARASPIAADCFPGVIHGIYTRGRRRCRIRLLTVGQPAA